MPLRSIPDRLHELDPASEIVLYCRTGARSMRALEFLRAHGFDRLRNLVGGVAAWSEQIDASFPKY
jgi:adenylyltransferase/sulfurtransferase